MLRKIYILEKCGVEIKYIEEKKNAAVDALSRFPISEEEEDKTEEGVLNLKVYEFNSCPVSS